MRKYFIISVIIFFVVLVLLTLVVEGNENTTINSFESSIFTSNETNIEKKASIATLIIANVSIFGEKTDVILGEEVLLKLSAVNIIGNPTMHVQVIIVPPSGMSVTSYEFIREGPSLLVRYFELEPGLSMDSEIRINPNYRTGNFYIHGQIIYYFGEDIENFDDYTLSIPFRVRENNKTIVDYPLSPGDFNFGLFLFCISSVLTFGLVLYFKVKKFPDIITIFAAVYGTLISFYFLWKL
ncbi:MAG TPA: hypothetical protein C5S50_00730 [Methanosarcinaceae archaeon]|nr:hypothetical protein [Methanosarcinaceae archaeon]